LFTLHGLEKVSKEPAVVVVVVAVVVVVEHALVS
jgi:hypothetical protein